MIISPGYSPLTRKIVPDFKLKQNPKQIYFYNNTTSNLGEGWEGSEKDHIQYLEIVKKSRGDSMDDGKII